MGLSERSTFEDERAGTGAAVLLRDAELPTRLWRTRGGDRKRRSCQSPALSREDAYTH